MPHLRSTLVVVMFCLKQGLVYFITFKVLLRLAISGSSVKGLMKELPFYCITTATWWPVIV